MSNMILNKALYSILALSTSLAVGSSLVSKNPFIITGTVGVCASGSIALFNKDKKLLEQQKRTNSLSLEIQRYTDNRINESKKEMNDQLECQFGQLQETIQEIKIFVKKTEQESKRNRKIDNARYNKTQRVLQTNCDKFNYRLKKLENTSSQKSTEVKAQSTKIQQVKPVPLKPVAEKKRLAVTQRPSRSSKTVIFIDQSNFHHACENLGIEPDYGSLMCKLTPQEGNCEMRIYLGVYNHPSRKQQDINIELKRLGYKVIENPIAVRENGTKKVIGDDTQLTCDLQAMVLQGEITYRDRVVLVSSDGDFKSVLEIVKGYNVKIDLVAHQPSHYLMPFVDQIVHLDRIKYDICQYKKLDAA